MVDKFEELPRFRYVLDLQNNEIYDTSKAKSLLYLTHNLAEENWKLRGDLVRLKLVIGMIIEDLEKTNQQDYAEWIKSECDVELFGQKHNLRNNK